MIVVDANVLIYAYHSGSPFHEPARRWVQDTFAGSALVRLPWNSILAFVRITTHRGILEQPFSRREATDIVEEWLAQPVVDVLHPGQRHWAILSQLIHRDRASGKLVMDAHLAALTIERGGVLHSCDRDFARFRGLKWHDPLQPAGWIHEG